MVLVAIAMVAIIAMAALSIDVTTLYLARRNALRMRGRWRLPEPFSISGITGDPSNQTGNWQLICGGVNSSATLVAQALAQQNAVGGSQPGP